MKPQKTVIERSLLSLTWPIFIDTLFVFLINAVDAWFLSRVSDTAAAAVGAVLPISAMCFTFFIALNTAGCAVAAQRLGAQNNHGLNITYGALFSLCAIAGMVICILLLNGATFLASAMGLTGETAAIGSLYLHTLGYGVFLLALRYGANAILQSQGKTQWNMLSTAVMTLINVVFNYLFIDGKWGFPSLGVTGIALATCLAWGSSLLFSLWVIFSKLRMAVNFTFSWAGFKHAVKPILSIAVPSSLEPLSWHMSQLIIISMVVSLGEITLAARVYAFHLIFIVILFTSALSAGVQLKISYFYGAGQWQAMHQQLHRGLYLGLAVIICLVSMLYLFAPLFLGIFTQNPNIIALGSTILALAIFCEIGRLLNMVAGFAVKTTGNAKFIAFFGITTMWVISVPLTWLLGIHWGYGLAGIWLAMGIDELLRGLVALTYWNKRQRKKYSLIASASPPLTSPQEQAAC